MESSRPQDRPSAAKSPQQLLPQLLLPPAVVSSCEKLQLPDSVAASCLQQQEEQQQQQGQQQQPQQQLPPAVVTSNPPRSEVASPVIPTGPRSELRNTYLTRVMSARRGRPTLAAAQQARFGEIQRAGPTLLQAPAPPGSNADNKTGFTTGGLPYNPRSTQLRRPPVRPTIRQLPPNFRIPARRNCMAIFNSMEASRSEQLPFKPDFQSSQQELNPDSAAAASTANAAGMTDTAAASQENNFQPADAVKQYPVQQRAPSGVTVRSGNVPPPVPSEAMTISKNKVAEWIEKEAAIRASAPPLVRFHLDGIRSLAGYDNPLQDMSQQRLSSASHYPHDKKSENQNDPFGPTHSPSTGIGNHGSYMPNNSGSVSNNNNNNNPQNAVFTAPRMQPLSPAVDRSSLRPSALPPNNSRYPIPAPYPRTGSNAPDSGCFPPNTQQYPGSFHPSNPALPSGPLQPYPGNSFYPGNHTATNVPPNAASANMHNNQFGGYNGCNGYNGYYGFPGSVPAPLLPQGPFPPPPHPPHQGPCPVQNSNNAAMMGPFLPGMNVYNRPDSSLGPVPFGPGPMPMAPPYPGGSNMHGYGHGPGVFPFNSGQGMHLPPHGGYQGLGPGPALGSAPALGTNHGVFYRNAPAPVPPPNMVPISNTVRSKNFGGNFGNGSPSSARKRHPIGPPSVPNSQNRNNNKNGGGPSTNMGQNERSYTGGTQYKGTGPLPPLKAGPPRQYHRHGKDRRSVKSQSSSKATSSRLRPEAPEFVASPKLEGPISAFSPTSFNDYMRSPISRRSTSSPTYSRSRAASMKAPSLVSAPVGLGIHIPAANPPQRQATIAPQVPAPRPQVKGRQHPQQSAGALLWSDPNNIWTSSHQSTLANGGWPPVVPATPSGSRQRPPEKNMSSFLDGATAIRDNTATEQGAESPAPYTPTPLPGRSRLRRRSETTDEDWHPLSARLNAATLSGSDGSAGRGKDKGKGKGKAPAEQACESDWKKNTGDKDDNNGDGNSCPRITITTTHDSSSRNVSLSQSSQHHQAQQTSAGSSSQQKNAAAMASMSFWLPPVWDGPEPSSRIIGFLTDEDAGKKYYPNGLPPKFFLTQKSFPKGWAETYVSGQPSTRRPTSEEMNKGFYSGLGNFGKTVQDFILEDDIRKLKAQGKDTTELEKQLRPPIDPWKQPKIDPSAIKDDDVSIYAQPLVAMAFNSMLRYSSDYAPPPTVQHADPFAFAKPRKRRTVFASTLSQQTNPPSSSSAVSSSTATSAQADLEPDQSGAAGSSAAPQPPVTPRNRPRGKKKTQWVALV